MPPGETYDAPPDLVLQFGGHRFANGVVDNEPFAAFPVKGRACNCS